MPVAQESKKILAIKVKDRTMVYTWIKVRGVSSVDSS
jgi:hypothetical protein